MSTPTVTTCQWYALCTNDTAQAVTHPILGPVPCCARCQAKHDMTAIPLPVDWRAQQERSRNRW